MVVFILVSGLCSLWVMLVMLLCGRCFSGLLVMWWVRVSLGVLVGSMFNCRCRYLFRLCVLILIGLKCWIWCRMVRIFVLLVWMFGSRVLVMVFSGLCR